MGLFFCSNFCSPGVFDAWPCPLVCSCCCWSVYCSLAPLIFQGCVWVWFGGDSSGRGLSCCGCNVCRTFFGLLPNITPLHTFFGLFSTCAALNRKAPLVYNAGAFVVHQQQSWSWFWFESLVIIAGADTSVFIAFRRLDMCRHVFHLPLPTYTNFSTLQLFYTHPTSRLDTAFYRLSRLPTIACCCLHFTERWPTQPCLFHFSPPGDGTVLRNVPLGGKEDRQCQVFGNPGGVSLPAGERYSPA